MHESPQSGPDAIETFLAALGRELEALRGIERRSAERLLAECAEHLHDLEMEFLRDGRSANAARNQAVAQFGDAADVAAQWMEAELSHDTPCRALGAWRWPVLSSVGLLVGLLLSVPAGRFADVLVGMMLVVPIAGVVLGACFGVSHGILIGSPRASVMQWSAATAVGMALGVTFGTVLVEQVGLRRGVLLEEALAFATIGGVAGLIVGVVQCTLLRAILSRAAWWVLATVAACMLGMLCGGLSASWLLGGMHGAAGFAVFALVCGPITGSITGVALNHLVEA